MSFYDLEKMMPNGWFVFQKETDVIVFGHFLNIKFKSRNSLLQLTFMRNKKVSIILDYKVIECHLLHIPSEREFNRSSIQALFQCMKIICPCQGYDISNNENKYTKISKCTKEICKQDCETMFRCVLIT